MTDVENINKRVNKILEVRETLIVLERINLLQTAKDTIIASAKASAKTEAEALVTEMS